LGKDWHKLGVWYYKFEWSKGGFAYTIVEPPSFFVCRQVLMECPIGSCAYLLTHLRIYVNCVGIQFDLSLSGLLCGVIALVMDHSMSVFGRVSTPGSVHGFQVSVSVLGGWTFMGSILFWSLGSQGFVSTHRGRCPSTVGYVCCLFTGFFLFTNPCFQVLVMLVFSSEGFIFIVFFSFCFYLWNWNWNP
jgi:hypothetical protein